MEDLVTTETTLPALAANINQEYAAVIETANMAVDHARRCGELLRQAKAQLQHGEWSAWVQENCSFSDRTARAYMRLADRLPALEEGKRQRVAEMPLREALAAIANERSELDKARALDIEGELLSRDLAQLLEEEKRLAQRVNDYSDFVVAVNSVIEDQAFIVAWWDKHRTCTVAEAEQLTGFKDRQIAKWRERLKHRKGYYFAWLYGGIVSELQGGVD